MRRRFFNLGGEAIDLSKLYFAIEALEDDLQVSYLSTNYEYCIDDGIWVKANLGTKTPSIKSGQVVYFRNTTPISGNRNGAAFDISKKCNLKGNIMSLLFGDNFEEYTDLTGLDSVFNFYFLYQPIVDATMLLLPATILSYYCYAGMFEHCTFLIAAPELPATTLAEDCYSMMFRGCSSLVTAPELPATTLADSCYSQMFTDCISLITPPSLPATTLVYYCYDLMFSGCTSLTIAPDLNATTLAEHCYFMMFSGNEYYGKNMTLKYIKMLATDISAQNCLKAWVKNVPQTGTFIKNSNMNSLPIGESGIPEGWTVVNA